VCHAFYNECQMQAKVHVLLSLAVLGVTVVSITFCIVILGVLMLSFAFLLNDIFCYYAECCYATRCYAECYGTP
jgi:hypothetical protein